MSSSRQWHNVVAKTSGAVCNVDLGAEDKHRAFFERNGWLDDDLCHRVRQRILDEIPYLAR